MEQQDLERIARAAMRDLGVSGALLTIHPDAQHPGYWKIDIRGGHGPAQLRIRCSEGSSPQWVRNQILEQYQAHG